MSKSNVKEKDMKNTPKQWNDTEVKLLKKWGEQAASYRVLHNRAYRKYKYLTALFTIPVIIISTVTGTANFSQGTIIQIYPSFELYLPLVIGTLNLISGIITTIGQFLRVSELNEANRNASISYGKFARNISTELSLPPNERSYNGIDFIQICRNEMDRLIEQSPEISMKIINKFEHNKKFKHVIKPELVNISSIEVYKPEKNEIVSEIVKDATAKFHENLLNTKMATSAQTIKKLSNTIPSKLNKKSQELELENIRGKGLVKNFANKNGITNILPNNNSKSNNNNSKSNNNNNIINTHVIDFDIDSNDYINNIGNNEVINSNNNLNNNDNDLLNFITNNKNKTPTLKKNVSRRMMNNINIFEQDDIEENNLRTIHNKINENTEDIKDNLEDLGDNLEGVEDNLEDLGDNLEGVEDNLEEAKDNVVKAVDSIKVNITEVFKDIIKQEDIYTDEKVQKSVNDFSQFLEINIDNIESAKKTIDNKINNNTETDTLEEYNCNEESLSTDENNEPAENNEPVENNEQAGNN
jgi:hypothetical protein